MDYAVCKPIQSFRLQLRPLHLRCHQEIIEKRIWRQLFVDFMGKFKEKDMISEIDDNYIKNNPDIFSIRCMVTFCQNQKMERNIFRRPKVLNATAKFDIDENKKEDLNEE